MAESMKGFFLAGLAVEEARERREKAREVLRARAAELCPAELSALEAATDALTEAEKNFNTTVQGLMKGESEKAMRSWMIEHAATCDNPQCEIKAQLNRADKAAEKLN